MKLQKYFIVELRKEGEEILSNGGRVLCVTGLGNDLDTAFEKAYEATSKISWSGAFIEKILKKESVNFRQVFPEVLRLDLAFA